MLMSSLPQNVYDPLFLQFETCSFNRKSVKLILFKINKMLTVTFYSIIPTRCFWAENSCVLMYWFLTLIWQLMVIKLSGEKLLSQAAVQLGNVLITTNFLNLQHFWGAKFCIDITLALLRICWNCVKDSSLACHAELGLPVSKLLHNVVFRKHAFCSLQWLLSACPTVQETSVNNNSFGSRGGEK
jgi:hypothetical protein